MVRVLDIKNFKSIRNLRLDCRRINVFIGEPNTGKSNILESLGLISYLGYSRDAEDGRGFVRYERTGNLFYDENLDMVVEVAADGFALTI